jgi:hypothetical protein
MSGGIVDVIGFFSCDSEVVVLNCGSLSVGVDMVPDWNRRGDRRQFMADQNPGATK